MSRIESLRSVQNWIPTTPGWSNNTPVLKCARREIVLCVLFVFAVVFTASAQFNSGFTGVVVEQTGSVVVGAKVTVTNQATHISH